MNKISLEINNGRHMVLNQYHHDGAIHVMTANKLSVDSEFTISAGDMVTMINWYRHQKGVGNDNLSFE